MAPTPATKASLTLANRAKNQGEPLVANQVQRPDPLQTGQAAHPGKSRALSLPPPE